MKIPLNEVVLGIDLGGTIHHKVDGQVVPMPHAFRIICDLKRIVKDVHIISRVNDEQSMRAYEWFQKFDFFKETTLTPNKVHFCYERLDKGPIAWKLGVTHFVDDRPEVMFGFQTCVTQYLMNPSHTDLIKFQEKIKGMIIVRDWLTVENLILANE